MGSPDNLFDSALNLEEAHIEEGYQEGLRDGQRLGDAEGRALGAQKGFEVGQELGFYAGCAQAWRAAQRAQPGAFSARADKAVGAIEDLVRGFPLEDPQDERLQELMDELRGRFKAAAAMLGPGDALLSPPGAQAHGQQQQQEQREPRPSMQF